MPPPSKKNQPKWSATEIINQLKNTPWLKKIALPLLLAWMYYLLTLVPVSQRLENCATCSPLKTSINQKLRLGNIISGRDNEILFEYIGDPKQAVQIHFDKARLDDNTARLLKHFLPDTPTNPQPVNFNTIQNKDSKTFIKVILRTPTVVPNALYLSPDLISNKTQPDFKLMADGLAVAIEIVQVKTTENNGSDDKNSLVIGNWHYKLAGIPVTIIPENGTNIVFRFSLAEWGPEKPFEPFFIPGFNNNENSGVISAQSVGTVATVEGNQTIDDLLCAAPTSEKILWLGSRNFRKGTCPEAEKRISLKLTAFNIAKETVQISAAGHAWAKINGELARDLYTYLKHLLENIKQLSNW
jgi:hypothetical protein